MGESLCIRLLPEPFLCSLIRPTWPLSGRAGSGLGVPKRYSGQFAHQLIAYQANTLRGDKFSDAAVCENLEFGLARLLKAGWGIAEGAVGVTRMAHQFSGACGEMVEQIFNAFSSHDAGLRDATEIVGGGETGVVGHFTCVAGKKFQAASLDTLFQNRAGFLITAGGEQRAEF
jgi:hypothetical protein